MSVQYSYDLLGRRAAATVNGVTTSFLYDAADLVSEITGASESQTLYGPGSTS